MSRWILQKAVLEWRPEEEILNWWNNHRKQDVRGIICIQHLPGAIPNLPGKVVVYYRM